MKPIQLAFALVLAAWMPVAAQTPPAGSLAGRVVDAATGQPVAVAVVTLEAAPAGVLVDARSASLVRVRSVITTDAGAYRFPSVVPGRYLMRIERLGYRSASIEVEVRRPVQATVSVGLELQPVALSPVQVERAAGPVFYRAANRRGELDEARVASERLRQRLFVAPDARMLTYADVMDGVTLGEGDVFRALQRFPGVGTRDDYTAELWTRGAPWTQTRVTFDGIPLFNPVHAVGMLSAIAPEVLGAAFFHPGMRPASVVGGAAGVVDLRSRPGGGDGELRGVADLSMASTKLVLDQNIDRRGAWLIAARRSHLGVLTEGLGSLGVDTIDLPYVFHDIAARGDLEIGKRAHLELSGLWEEDDIIGDVEGVIERTAARWGNTAARATLRARIGGLDLEQTVGGSRFSARTSARVVRTREPAPLWTEPASRNDIEYLQLVGQISPAVVGDYARWSAGYDVAAQDVSYEGPLPRYYAVEPDTTAHLRYDRELRVLGVWGEARFAVGRVTVNPGLRLETGDEIQGAARVRVAPQVAARVALTADHTFSIGVSRSWQYVQAIGLAGPSIHPAFHASHFWVWAGENTPALRTDIVSVGTERWLGGGWLASAGAFARKSEGVTMPHPDSLRTRRLFVTGTNTASGLELSLRRIGARWSATAGYSLGKSRVEAAGLRFPGPADRTHVVDAMLGLRLSDDWRVAGAYTAMSGAPFTRAYARTPEDCTAFGFGCGNAAGSFIEDPNAERTPAYASLDASLQWARPAGPVELSAYLQVRNVLGRDNASTYAGTIPVPLTRPARRDGQVVTWRLDDRFEKGLPRLPLIGLRVTF